MKLIKKINADFITAFKSSKGNEAKKMEKDFLGLLKSEFTKESKEPEDAFVISKIKAMIKNAAATNSLNEVELKILNSYLPEQLTEAELLKIINEEVKTHGYELMSNMGKIMSFLKNNYGGQYDGKMASTLVRTLLK